jgi:hypothetical protein
MPTRTAAETRDQAMDEGSAAIGRQIDARTTGAAAARTYQGDPLEAQA